MSIIESGEMSPREHIIMQAEQEEARLSREHAVTIKNLELEIKRQDNVARVQLKQLESKWASWLRLPSLALRLPVMCLLSLAYIACVICKKEPPKDFWRLLS